MHVAYSRPNVDDRLNSTFDSEQRVSVQLIAELLQNKTEEVVGDKSGADVHFVLCGPAAFMTKLTTNLAASGVTADCTHTENFVPQAT